MSRKEGGWEKEMREDNVRSGVCGGKTRGGEGLNVSGRGYGRQRGGKENQPELYDPRTDQKGKIKADGTRVREKVKGQRLRLVKHRWI